jgi:3-hydroxyacyl-CoA dehydrogenase/enoyl-CoA hydratase/3-hydroxybutyryl-CoA epimerase
MNKAVSLDVAADGIATITIDVPGQALNTLSRQTLDEIDRTVGEIEQRSDVKVVIFRSGKEGSFIAGADLKEIGNVFRQEGLAEALISHGHQVFSRIAALPVPTIALVNGVCLGGGMEFALACTYRVATDHPKTALGLPETSLGIIPGWGGTQRAPRLVGLANGVSMILTGKRYKPKDALKIHLVDRVVPFPFAQQQAASFAREVITDRGRKKVLASRRRPWLRSFLLEGNPIGRAVLFRQARQEVLKKTKGHYPAPLVALDLIKRTQGLSLEEGLIKEREAFVEATPAAFAVAPNLVGLFFGQEALKKDPGVIADVSAQPVTRAAVIGAGVMGAGIIWALADKEIPVTFKEANWEGVAKGYGTIHGTFDLYVRKLRKVTPDQANLRFHFVRGTVDLSGMAQADIVIEAAVEDLELKKKLLIDLESHVRDDTIIATNTSSLPIDELASVLKHPERFIGMHFFNPVTRMPLVEVIPGAQTNAQTIATTVALVKRLDKTPLVVKDVPGFLVNRIVVPVMTEALLLLQEGVEMERIEKIITSFGMPMGPFELADEVGNDVTYKVARILEKAYGDRVKVPQLLQMMYDEKLLGRKVGAGFYVYKGSKKWPNKRVKKLLKKIEKKDTLISDETVQARIIYGMMNEAARCLEEGVVSKASHLDLALVMGAGFPPFRGGILRYADTVGVPKVVEALNTLSQTYGSRFQPSSLLIKMQQTNASFYPA